MTRCIHCRTEKQEVIISGEPMELCMHTGCIMDRMLDKYSGCAHSFEVRGEHLLKCTECGMGATPSYTK